MAGDSFQYDETCQLAGGLLLQVWPHHSLRGEAGCRSQELTPATSFCRDCEDWLAVAAESQPTLPRRSSLRLGGRLEARGNQRLDCG